MTPTDSEASRAYVAARSPALLSTAYLLTGDRGEAEDLLQAALIKLCLSWRRVRDREALDGYVRRIMVNTRTSAWRKHRVPTVPLQEHLPAQVVIPPGPEDRMVLWDALRGLAPRQRATLVLRFWEDLSEADTAELLGCSIGTVKSTTSRALAKLRADTGLRDLVLSVASAPSHLSDLEEL